MIRLLRTFFPERSPLRLFYHKMRAKWAATRFGFPAEKLRVIAVTGTSGKSTTVELITHLLQHGGQSTGSFSTIQMTIKGQAFALPTLRTSQKPEYTQKILREMVTKGCQNVVLEVSSHAIDQHRIAGINVDTAVMTNLFDNEHLDYHETFEDYKNTKKKLLEEANGGLRKPGVPKMAILNKDDAHFEDFDEVPSDKKWYFARKKTADIKAENISHEKGFVAFDLRLPNANLRIKSPLLGTHNIENLLCAIAVAISHGVAAEKLPGLIESFPGVPGRLENIDEGQDFQVLVDFTYKPSAMKSVLSMIRSMMEESGKLIVVWGGAGGRTKQNHILSAKLVDTHADKFILTTDDPGMTPPKAIAANIMPEITRQEGDGTFWNIEDRYEAIRHAMMTAERGDLVLLAGRGHEKIQIIGTQEIPFDDREVARDILRKMQGKTEEEPSQTDL